MKFASTNTPLTGIILGVSLLVSLIGGATIAHNQITTLEQSHHNLAQNLSRQLARAAHLALLAGDNAELNKIAQSVLATDTVLGRVTIRHSDGRTITQAVHTAKPATALDRWAARAARRLGGRDTQMRYSAQIPPAGEGSLLDPFGTPRADIGLAILQLSTPYYSRDLARQFYNALLVWLLLFLTFVASGYGIAWAAALPMLRLGRRLRTLTGEESGVDATPTNYAEIERNLAVISQRLARSEDQAREATLALQGQALQLEQARAAARDAAHMRADSVAGMSHELRTPLTAILGHADLLARSSLDRRQSEYVATVRKSARNLLSLINDVLEWSELDSGRASANEVGFNLAETVEDTLTLLAPLAFEKDLELAQIIYRDVPLRLRGDPQRFQQVLTNLISNAIKFTPAGGITVRIMLEDEDNKAIVLRVSVADTGPGIPLQGQQQLFNMYERLDGAASIGSGLGLAISKRLLELMGGEISVDSEVGKGADFQFLLPLKKSLHREQNTVPWSGLDGLCMWIQDDNHTARLALAHHLETWRIDVLEMDTRQDLLTCLDNNPAGQKPAMAIIGLRAKDTNDPALHALLAACRAAQLPVLTLVTSIDADLHTRLEAIGASASLPKSLNRLQLYRQLRQLTGAELPPDVEPPQPLAGLNLLIAENSPAARGYLTALLTHLGAGVAQVENGQAAVDAWRKGNFPLVLLDGQMPVLDGAGASMQIRSLAASDNQPVLIGITADSRASAQQRLIRAGMDTCLLKPFDEQQLLHCLQPFLPRIYGATNRPQSRATRPRTHELIADPKLAKQLRRELPRQRDALSQALANQDVSRAAAEIHTLHGTAAFYGLDELKRIAMQIEGGLQTNQTPSTAQLQRLDKVLKQAVAGLPATPPA